MVPDAMDRASSYTRITVLRLPFELCDQVVRDRTTRSCVVKGSRRPEGDGLAAPDWRAPCSRGGMQPNKLRPYREPATCEGMTNTGVHRKEPWLVQVTPEDLRPMSVDEVSEAYQKGLIDERTLVLPDGTFQWAELGDVCDDESLSADDIIQSS